jgi:hypothetical protein
MGIALYRHPLQAKSKPITKELFYPVVKFAGILVKLTPLFNI